MKRSGMPAMGSRPLEVVEWRGGTQCGRFGRATPDAGNEKVRWRMVVGRNESQQARRALGEATRAVGIHHTQDMIRQGCQDGQGAEDAWGGGGLSRCRRYASALKVVFADVDSPCREHLFEPSKSDLHHFQGHFFALLHLGRIFDH